MDEIEHIFPEEPPKTTKPVPVAYDVTRAHKAVTEYCFSLRQREERLQHELDDVHYRAPLLDELHQYVHDKWSLHVVDWFARNKDVVEDISRSIKTGLPGAMMSVLREAVQDADELKKRYSLQMDTTAAKRKLRPDATSRHPVYRFQKGFFTVSISEPGFTARIEDLAGPLVDRMPADPSAIIGYLQRERTRIFERPFDPAVFLQKLLKNYLAIVEREPELKVGEPMPIRRITGRLHDNEKGFRNDEFLVDLTQLLDSHVSDVDGWTLTLEQTKDIERGLYVFPKYGPGYIGFLRFTRRG
jgi:hypothetical protein